jgi:hypothetical protein
MKVICKFKYWSRYCTVSGIFIEDKDIIDYVLERNFEIYGGELAGKHSSVTVPVNKDTLEVVSDNQEAIKWVEQLELENGFNPFNYLYTNYDGDEYDTFREYVIKQLKELENE